MKSTSAVAKSTSPKHKAHAADAPATASTEMSGEFVGLSPDELNRRASTSSQVMTEILQRNHDSYSFRHWGINE